MLNHVIIKSNPHGLIINLDPELPFSELLAETEEKFKASAPFFKHAQIALSFSGRDLSAEEERDLTNAIIRNSGLQVVCLMDEDEENTARFRAARDQALTDISREDGYLHYGDLTKGEQLEKLCSIVIVGNIHPGAQVRSCGNIIVLGSCQGTVWAGCGGNASCFVTASDLRPRQLQIASRTARSAISRREAEVDYTLNPQIAFLDEQEHITIRPLSRKALENVLLSQTTGR